jgi:lipopolysaccharide biosynthesis glycosyltransferase
MESKNIVMSSDARGLEPNATVIASLLAHTEGPVWVRLFSRDIPPVDISSGRLRIEVISTPEDLRMVGRSPTHVHSAGAFDRLAAMKYCADWSRAVLFDYDQVVVGDPTELFEMPLHDSLAAVRLWPGVSLGTVGRWWDSDMMKGDWVDCSGYRFFHMAPVLNLAAIRESEAWERLVSFHKAGNMDEQAALCAACEDRVIGFDPKLNWFPTWNQIPTDAKILHFVREKKPWNNSELRGAPLWRKHETTWEELTCGLWNPLALSGGGVDRRWEELERVVAAARRPGQSQRVLEIGGWDFPRMLKRARKWMTSVNDCWTVLFRPHVDPVALGEAVLRFAGSVREIPGRTEILDGHPVEALAWMLTEEEGWEGMDAVILHAPRRGEDFLSEAFMAWKLLKPGGVMIIHPVAKRPGRVARKAFLRNLESFIHAVGDGMRDCRKSYHTMLVKAADSGQEISLGEATNRQEVVLFEGFFNRLNGLVAGLLLHGPGFKTRWAVNRHLPHRFEELFDRLSFSDVVNTIGPGYHKDNIDAARGALCYWYLPDTVTASRDEVAAAYRVVISRLKVPHRELGVRAGIHFRGEHRSARTNAVEFAQWCLTQLRSRGIDRCFVLADTSREEIGAILTGGGIEITWGKAPPLSKDLDRRDLDAIKEFIADALALAECETVLTSFDETTIVDPARAFGREVVAFSGSRAWSRCYFREREIRPQTYLSSPSPSVTDGKFGGSRPRILIADTFLSGRPNADWKEGYELCYAFRNLGIDCNVAGPGGHIPETRISEVAGEYGLVIITENYPNASGWKWWDWHKISTPKLFWAVDTHLVDYRPWIQHAEIDFVAFNNPDDMARYGLQESFSLPYAASARHHFEVDHPAPIRDVAFIGGMTQERRRLCDRFGIEHVTAFGPDYVKEMAATRICVNLSISYDLNAKYLEILASGAFMLTNPNPHFHRLLGGGDDVAAMFFHSEDELGEKLRYYLSHEDERAALAASMRSRIREFHCWENRAAEILRRVGWALPSIENRAAGQGTAAGGGLESEFEEILARLEWLRRHDRPQYLYGTHVEVLHSILASLKPAPDEVLLEVGGGQFSTRLLLSTRASVFTLEQGQNVPEEANRDWIQRLRKMYGGRSNWHLMDLPGTTAWRSMAYPTEILFCFVDGNGDCRKEMVEFMLERAVPVVAAHDSETASFRYDEISAPFGYSVHDFRGREVWTRVWSADLRVTAALDRRPDCVRVGSGGFVFMRGDGRIGNQLFQLAYGLYLKRVHGCKLLGSLHLLEGVEGVSAELVHGRSSGCEVVVREVDLGADPSIIDRLLASPEHSGILLEGYFQTYGHFELVEDELRGILGDAGKTDLLGVHVRRTDYVGTQFDAGLSPEYYAAGVRRLLDGSELKSGIVVFSDDPEWCRANLVPQLSAILPTRIHDGDAIEALRMMKSMAGMVIANSTFSWWGAWLAGCPTIHPPFWPPDKVPALGCSLHNWICLDLSKS